MRDGCRGEDGVEEGAEERVSTGGVGGWGWGREGI